MAALDEAPMNDLVDRLRTFFNAHDLGALTSLMTEDVVFEHPLGGTMHGREQIRAFYTGFFAAFPDAAVEPADGPFFHPHAPRLTMEWLGTGTNTGPLNPPGLAPGGRSIHIHLWETFELRDGLLSRIRQGFDTADAMRQIGILPARDSRAERVMAAFQRLRAKLPCRRRQPSKAGISSSG